MRATRYALALVALSAALPASADDCPQVKSIFPRARVLADEINNLVASVKLRPGTTCKRFGPLQIQCNSDSTPELWWFTEPGHSAHPSASRGQLLFNQNLGEICLLRDGYFAGDEGAFASWLQELKQYDEATVDTFMRMKAPKPQGA